MKVEKLIHKYLSQADMMQVATADSGQPWICTVYFVADEDANLYWISTPSRRHSQEIAKNSKVAAAIPIKYVGHPVVGLQAEGEADLVADQGQIKKAMRLYTDKFKIGEDFYNDFLAGKNSHKLYRIKPRVIVLFDEENFADNSRQEWKP